MARFLALAGACAWVLSMAVVVQRQRVLDRRLARLERARPGAHRAERRPAPPADLLTVLGPRVVAKGLLRSPVTAPRPSRRPPGPPPTVQQLAALTRPLQRAGG